MLLGTPARSIWSALDAAWQFQYVAKDQLAWHFPVRRRHLRGAFCSLFLSSQVSSYVAFPPSVWLPGAFITSLKYLKVPIRQ